MGSRGRRVETTKEHGDQNQHPGQISSRPHTTDLPQKVAFWKGNGTPKISGKSIGWWNISPLGQNIQIYDKNYFGGI